MYFLSSRVSMLALVFIIGVSSLFPIGAALAEGGNPESSVMSEFTSDMKDNQIVDDEVKHKILFWMGIILLILIIATATIGINMAFFGKELFVAHMITAGTTVFLSLAHAVTAVVWFFPF